MLGVIGLNGTHVDNRFSAWFAEGTDFRTSVDGAREAIGGIESVSWTLRTRDGPPRAEDIAAIRRLRDWLDAQPGVTSTVTAADAVRAVWTGKLDDQRQPTAMTILSSRSSDPTIGGLRSADGDALRVIATLGDSSSSETLNLNRALQSWASEQKWANGAPQPGGPTWALAILGQENARSMLWGTVFAFLAIGAALAFLLRSYGAGAVGLFAVCLPPVVVYGWLAARGDAIGLSEAVVAATSLGLLVDAAIHVLARYRRQCDRGSSPDLAMRRALAETGPAI